MKYTIYLNGDAARVVDNEVVAHLDVMGYEIVIESGVVKFWLEIDDNGLRNKYGFYKMCDVKYVLPIQ